MFARVQRTERCRRAARIASFSMLSAIPAFPVGAASTIDPPTGVYLWYPQKGTAPSDSDCRDLVRNTRPSVEKAEDWLWGRVPNDPDNEPEFYLFVRQHDMETTYKSLPLRPHWRTFAQRAAKAAYALDEVRETLAYALKREPRRPYRSIR